MKDYTELVTKLRDVYRAYVVTGNEKAGQFLADAAAAIEALEAEVERLKDANDELREAQTYIDNYGDKWMTSAKDVPTSAYNHGYMDGKNEAEQALEPKRGEWKRDEKRWGENSIRCSLCGAVIEDEEWGWRNWNYCYHCGAKMEPPKEEE